MPRNKLLSSEKYTSENRVRLVKSGKEYFNALLSIISAAKKVIHIQVYIYNDDETGKMISDALKKAVERNVAVFLMADGYASQSISRSFIAELKKSGIRFRFFEPILKSRYFYFGRRMHHKIAVADAKFALVGGINIADRYNDMPQIPAWLDFAAYMEGEIAQHLFVLCEKTWNGFLYKKEIVPSVEKQIVFFIPPGERSEIRMRRNDWVRRKNEISKTYVSMLRTAKSHVTILCSYFLPGKVMRMQMAEAVKRGISLKVITAGASDVMVAKQAERWLYDWLLRNNIELYEYQKNILHGKIAVCDNEWMTVGSYNINNISAYASLELNVDVSNAVFATDVQHVLNGIIENDCVRITTEHHIKTKNIFKQFIRWGSYQFIRMIFFLFTFYFKHQR